MVKNQESTLQFEIFLGLTSQGRVSICLLIYTIPKSTLSSNMSPIVFLVFSNYTINSICLHSIALCFKLELFILLSPYCASWIITHITKGTKAATSMMRQTSLAVWGYVETAVDGLLADLQIATPKINGFFATATRQIAGSVGAVYAVAQCVETYNKTSCLDCLSQAYSMIRSCPPRADGRDIIAGCFLRFSNTAFFAENQTTNITPFLRSGNISFQPSTIFFIFLCFFL